MVPRARGACGLHIVTAGWVLLQIETVRESAVDVFIVGVGEKAGRRPHVLSRRSVSTRILVHYRHGIVVAAVLMTAAEFNSLHRILQGVHVVYVLIASAHVRLGVDIVATDID